MRLSPYMRHLRPCRVAILLFVAVLWMGVPLASAQANPKYASIVVDYDTGQVLHQRYADKKLHPASLTKVMTLLMVFDQIQSGRLGMNDRIRMSKNAAAAVPSKLGLPIGSSIRVKDAIYALVTKSANDVALAIAEHIGRNETHFARMMTDKARSIGMSRTTFKNASGLHDPRQVTTARDMALMGRYLIRNYPHEYKYFSRQYFTYQGKTYRNHNRLMASYNGMDGIKTGYINASGFNLLASAQRNGRRLIGVVFGGRTTKTRNAHMRDLLDRSFANLPQLTIAAADVPIPGEKPVNGIGRLAALNAVQPASGYTQTGLRPAPGLVPPRKDGAQGQGDFSTHWASLNTALQSGMFEKLAGQGDYDSDFSERIKTGLMAISAYKTGHGPAPGPAPAGASAPAGNAGQAAARPTPQRLASLNRAQDFTSINDFWSIQVGAFTSRVQTERAIHQARQKLPASLAQASSLIVPLQKNNAWLFRGRLNGYNETQAKQACRLISDCIVIAPRG